MTTRIAINGFGRIGRAVGRAAVRRGSGLDLVAINDIADIQTLAHLLTYDSVHGRFPGSVRVRGDHLEVNGRPILVSREPEASHIDWSGLAVDIVFEATGLIERREDALLHRHAGARMVLVSKPLPDADITLVRGFNDAALDPARHRVVSNASCTTHAIIPMIRVLDETFGWERGFMVTVHPYTNDQPVLDSAHRDLRRARTPGMSIIPTTSTAIETTVDLLPWLAGRLDGYAVRVPTPNVAIADLIVEVGRDVTGDEVNTAFHRFADASSGILGVSDDPLVSVDYMGDTHSVILDTAFTTVTGRRLVHISGWYDNEAGYAARSVELMAMMGRLAETAPPVATELGRSSVWRPTTYCRSPAGA